MGKYSFAPFACDSCSYLLLFFLSHAQIYCRYAQVSMQLVFLSTVHFIDAQFIGSPVLQIEMPN
jgi:hypothetical protein